MLHRFLPLAFAFVAACAHAQPTLDPELLPLAREEVPAVLDTLRQLTSVDSGTGQAAGLAAVAAQVEQFAQALGAQVQRVAPANGVAGQNLVITFRGRGQRRIMLMAHMDTVYLAGTAAARPFRIDGKRAIAPGIADDKGGIAVFLHAMKLLKARGFDDYERVTLVLNTDEERGSAGSRDLIREQAARHDAVLSGEPTGPNEMMVIGTSGAGYLRVMPRGPQAVDEMADMVLRTREVFRQVQDTRMNWTLARVEDRTALADAGAAITWRIRGRASHAGAAPHLGINAVVEGAMLVQRVNEAAASMPGVRLHWRAFTGGQVSNIIPDQGMVQAEVAAPNAAEAAAMLAQTGAQVGLRGAQVAAEITPGGAPASPGGEVFASADLRVPTPEAFALLTKLVREKVDAKKHASSTLAVIEGLPFPPFNMTQQGRAIAETVIAIDRQLGGEMVLGPRAFGATDAAWAGQSGQPVVEGLGLPGGNYHSSDEEFIFVDRIPRRLALVAEAIRAIAHMEVK